MLLENMEGRGRPSPLIKPDSRPAFFIHAIARQNAINPEISPAIIEQMIPALKTRSNCNVPQNQRE